jgi:hypothetical protein
VKRIPLTQGKFAIVDDDDFDRLVGATWRAQKNYSTWYAVSNINNFYMHRLVCNAAQSLVVDHINGNGLDNRKENLRAVSLALNNLNSKMNRNNTSGYRGVVLDKRTGKWSAQLQLCQKGKKQRIFIGTFPTPEDAHQAYQEEIFKRYGVFSRPKG